MVRTPTKKYSAGCEMRRMLSFGTFLLGIAPISLKERISGHATVLFCPVYSPTSIFATQVKRFADSTALVSTEKVVHAFPNKVGSTKDLFPASLGRVMNRRVS